ncbi:hypothetical protein W823_18360 [Williamsia sp. D3]|nr:hypothetical protein W823_18360 [Williamsia sp. D3]
MPIVRRTVRAHTAGIDPVNGRTPARGNTAASTTRCQMKIE